MNSCPTKPRATRLGWSVWFHRWTTFAVYFSLLMIPLLFTNLTMTPRSPKSRVNGVCWYIWCHRWFTFTLYMLFVVIPLLTSVFATALSLSILKKDWSAMAFWIVGGITGTPATELPAAWANFCLIIGLLSLGSVLATLFNLFFQFDFQRLRLTDCKAELDHVLYECEKSTFSSDDTIERLQRIRHSFKEFFW